MSRKKQSKKKNNDLLDVFDDTEEESESRISQPAKQALITVLLLTCAIFFILAGFGVAGNVGNFIHEKILVMLFGYGMVLIPTFFIIFAVMIHRPVRKKVGWIEGVSTLVAVCATLGILDLLMPNYNAGGVIGRIIARPLISLFEVYVTGFFLIIFIIASLVLLFNTGIPFEKIGNGFISLFKKKNVPSLEEGVTEDDTIEDPTTLIAGDVIGEPLVPTEEIEVAEKSEKKKGLSLFGTKKDESQEDEVVIEDMHKKGLPTEYTFPPVSLLGKSSGKPLPGDIKAQANLIKRTLLNFGIHVEMDEVSIGPTVTRYALKPAEGIKLSRIVGLQNDLALALAAHPLRIEAPIPGKSLVGIEVPNKTKATVGLASLLEDSQFTGSPKRLLVSLGKGVTGRSYFADLAKMPHLLIAGATGSGKSVTVHNLIISLLYRNSYEDLRFIMVDPKRVELTLYNNIPHLLTPVIKEPKKAILALKWAAKEMERRYDILESFAVRDIGSYHKTIVEPAYAEYQKQVEKAQKKGAEIPSSDDLPERMPYIVVIIDELADIMQAYPRELESGIVRLAQMSRAVGIHLVLSTQRPSVNVITGLIKANVPARLALQVASQIDSRTILDASGAESLLGAGDMLYLGSDMSKPERMQCAFISEEEVKSVVSFIVKNNEEQLGDGLSFGDTLESDNTMFSTSMNDGDDEDDLYEDARAIVIEAGKASTSYIQRKLKVGYSRAARLMDMLEDRGVIGPADGAKPREILVEHGGSHNNDNQDNA